MLVNGGGEIILERSSKYGYTAIVVSTRQKVSTRVDQHDQRREGKICYSLILEKELMEVRIINN